MSVLVALLLSAAVAQPDPNARPPDSVPVAGVADAPRRGPWVQAALGVFTAMGGSRRFSSGQPYLGMTLGHDLGERAAAFLSLGVGAASAQCYQPDPDGSCLGADAFGATFIDLGVSWGIPLLPRTLLSVGLLGGITDLSPGPVLSGGSVPDHLRGFHAGASVSLEYRTRLEHFGLGIEAIFRETFAASALKVPSLAVMPRIRYVF